MKILNDENSINKKLVSVSYVMFMYKFFIKIKTEMTYLFKKICIPTNL